MTRREKILVLLTGLTALLGLSGLFGRAGLDGGAPDRQAREAASARAGAMRQSVKELAVSRFEAALVASIGRSWRRAALYDKPLAVQAKVASTAPRYTGYVELGSGRLAVVDGIEYQVGDRLEGGGYRVTAITPERVALESVGTGGRIEIPYEGQDAATR